MNLSNAAQSVLQDLARSGDKKAERLALLALGSEGPGALDCCLIALERFAAGIGADVCEAEEASQTYQNEMADERRCSRRDVWGE